MKLLNINYSDFLGGSAVATLRLHNAFIDNGINSWMGVCSTNNKEKHVLTFKNKIDKIEYLLKKNVVRTFIKYFEKKNHLDYSLSIFDNPLFSDFFLNSFDMINLHWIGNETLSLKQINKLKKPVVWTLTDMWPFLGAEHVNYFDEKKKYYWNDERILYKKDLNLNNFFLKRKIKNYNNIQPVAISQWLADKASQSIIFKNKKIPIIPPTLNFDIWKPLIDEKIKNTFFHGDKKIILFSSSGGTGDYKKGFSYLVNALKRFKNIKDYHLVILGKLNSEEIEGIDISYTEISKNFFGDIKGLLKIYSSVDLLVMPSLVEAFGQVSLEAAACNIPTIAFDNTGVQEIIKHKKNGYLAEYKNTEDLCYGIDWCLEDNNLKNLKKNCRLFAIEKFSNKKIVSKYQKLYENLN